MRMTSTEVLDKDGSVWGEWECEGEVEGKERGGEGRGGEMLKVVMCTEKHALGRNRLTPK